MRKVIFSENEFYHIYNRGVDKRVVFNDKKDFDRFFESIRAFNSVKPIGSIFENSFHHANSNKITETKNQKNLVSFVAYCINPNHYHFILKQVSEKGVEKFMHKLSTGYTNYFNAKYKRTGSLFQGRFRAVHIDSNEYLLHLSAYVNLNDRAHQLENLASKFGENVSSWREYTENNKASYFCEKDIILEQFKNVSEYKKFANDALESIIERKKELQEIENYLLE